MPFFGHDSRYLNNDMDCLHELLLLDIAAGMRRLRELGFDQIVLVGNSGGGSLFSYYQAQASAAPEERFAASPAGDGGDLPDLVGNSGDGILFSHYRGWRAEGFAVSPAGDGVDLPNEEMPQAALFVSIASHLGDGHIFQNMLDPSVVDDRDPDSRDPDLDMYDRANGHKPWPEASHYEPDWLAHYREAQAGPRTAHRRRSARRTG